MDVDELIECLSRLRGSQKSVHSVIVQGEFVRESQRTRRLIKHTEEELETFASRSCESLQTTLLKKISELFAETSGLSGTAQHGEQSQTKFDTEQQQNEESRCRLENLLKAVEERKGEAATTLRKLSSDLMSSRLRVRALELQVKTSSCAVQTGDAVQDSDNVEDRALSVFIVQARGLCSERQRIAIGECHPYAIVRIAEKELKTEVIRGIYDPVWTSPPFLFSSIPRFVDGMLLHVSVWTDSRSGPLCLGRVDLELPDLPLDQAWRTRLALEHGFGGELEIELCLLRSPSDLCEDSLASLSSIPIISPYSGVDSLLSAAPESSCRGRSRHPGGAAHRLLRRASRGQSRERRTPSKERAASLVQA